MRFTPSLILVFALTVTTAQASQYEGRINSILADGTVRITESKLKKTFDLTYKDDSAKSAVAKLQKNDFVSFEGVKNLTKAFLRVDSVNYVGLSALMGVWTGDDKYCYKFSNPTEFVIFPNSGNCSGKQSTSTAAPREFAYTLNSSDSNWFMLLSDAQARYAADVTIIDPKNVELNLYDVNNGKTLRLIKLSR